MERPYVQLDLEREGDAVCARLRHFRMDETAIHALGNELTRLVEEDGCRKLALSLGPGSLECLFSVFLAKLVMTHRLLHERGGALVLCDVPPEVVGVFDACRLKDFFEFAPDRPAALAALARKGIS